MLRNIPKFKYCGLTIILSNPSRFDNLRLLSANGGVMFENFCLRPEFNSMQCDVRLKDETAPFLPDTKCILLLGDTARVKYLPETLTSTLSNIRGALYYYKNIPTICSFLPQDAVDIKDYESETNPLSSNYSPDDSVSSDEDDDTDVKTFGNTKRSNYAFWLKRDVWKCKQILQGKYQPTKPPEYKIYPHPEEVINALEGTKGSTIFFDIETDYEEQNLQCFAFNDICNNVVYSIPILDYRYNRAYISYYRILKAFAICARDNRIVAHNGSNFDFFVLANKYGIPVKNPYDTMIAFQRCFPDIERSLGHGMSYFTWEKFHKSENAEDYRTEQQMMDRLKYCAKDVWGMRLLYEGINQFASTIPGLNKSIDDAMSCINPYLISTIQGIKCDEEKINKKINENDRLMLQYNRMIEILIGEVGLRCIRSILKGKVGLFAGSNRQCCEYFHNLLGYKVVGRSSKTQEPSLGKKNLYKLALQYDNPVIKLICLYRQVQKETSRLKFTPWQSDYDKRNSNIQEASNAGDTTKQNNDQLSQTLLTANVQG